MRELEVSYIDTLASTIMFRCVITPRNAKCLNCLFTLFVGTQMYAQQLYYHSLYERAQTIFCLPRPVAANALLYLIR